ncbi:MAG: response regulator transcription factor [Bacilli bacterium]|nr:response regulator transcription factor [Bacilli bacterium]
MKILLAEDDRDLSSTIVRVLKANKFDVDPVYDGQEALDYLEYGNYDGFVCDVMMPKKDGFTVVREIRKKGNNIPVMILTAKGEIDDKVLGLDIGADDYLTKPFIIKEFLARLRAILRRGGDVKEAYHVGNITLDHENFSLTGPNGSLHLTATEYKLLEYLIAHKGGVLSTERLLENVWDYEADVGINVVWAYVSAVRKKLEEVGSDIELKAMRGVGYQLCEKAVK